MLAALITRTDNLLNFNESNMKLDIAFVGGGNMAGAMIGGLLQSGIDKDSLHVAESNPERRQHLSQLGISVYPNSRDMGKHSCLVLAVKPQTMAQACAEIKDLIASDTLVISIAAGIRSETLQKWLGAKVSVVRAMPNTPALFGVGASGLFASAEVNSTQKEIADKILSATGIVQWFDKESDIDIVTALSGSGPAYYFRIMEVMIEAAVTAGLEPEAATHLTLQTALGAALMAQKSDSDLATLRQNVTSKGGTTERGLEVLQSHDIAAIFKQVIDAATARSEELSQQLSGTNQ